MPRIIGGARWMRSRAAADQRSVSCACSEPAWKVARIFPRNSPSMVVRPWRAAIASTALRVIVRLIPFGMRSRVLVASSFQLGVPDSEKLGSASITELVIAGSAGGSELLDAGPAFSWEGERPGAGIIVR